MPYSFRYVGRSGNENVHFGKKTTTEEREIKGKGETYEIRFLFHRRADGCESVGLNCRLICSPVCSRGSFPRLVRCSICVNNCVFMRSSQRRHQYSNERIWDSRRSREKAITYWSRRRTREGEREPAAATSNQMYIHIVKQRVVQIVQYIVYLQYMQLYMCNALYGLQRV